MYQKGCICLDDIPEGYISEYRGKDGKKKKYIHFHIYPLQEPMTVFKNGREITYTHAMSLMPANYGEGKFQIAQLEERASPLDGKIKKQNEQPKKKPTNKQINNTNKIEDDYLF